MIDFKVKREDFLLALQNVGNAVRDNKTIPAISGIYLDVKEDSFEIRGTDLELSISARVDAEIASPGIAVIKSSTLQDYLREINDDIIRIQQINNEINITTANSSSSYSIIDHNEYPETFTFEPASFCSVGASDFTEAVEKTIVGAATTPDNLAVHSVRLDITGNKMRVITSDTYRLFFFEKEISSESDIRASIPLKTANAILKIIRNVGSEGIEISYSKNLIHFKIGNVEILSKLIDLPYPDYESIINNFNSDKEVLCNNEELTSMLKRVQFFARDNSDVRNGANFYFKDNCLEVKAISDQAKVKEKMSIVKKGDDVSIALNVKFVLDYLNQIEKNSILKLSDSDSAVLLSEEDNDNFLCLTQK